MNLVHFGRFDFEPYDNSFYVSISTGIVGFESPRFIFVYKIPEKSQNTIMMNEAMEKMSFTVAIIYLAMKYIGRPENVSYHITSNWKYTIPLTKSEWYEESMKKLDRNTISTVGNRFIPDLKPYSAEKPN
jgi:hypothetical protein